MREGLTVVGGVVAIFVFVVVGGVGGTLGSSFKFNLILSSLPSLLLLILLLVRPGAGLSLLPLAPTGGGRGLLEGLAFLEALGEEVEGPMVGAATVSPHG